jgi:hypothetical protein
MFRKLSCRPDWQIAMALTAVLRVFYSAMAAALSPFLHPDPTLIHSNALTENLPALHGLHYALLGIWERFDTLWYLRIAEHGYDRPMSVIFYPLYPATIRVVSAIMPATGAALVIATIAAFFFFWGLLRLADSGLTDYGRLRMLILVAVWPASFTLFAGYAESLTIALIVWAVIFARGGQWWAAALCGLLAGLGRPSGVLVGVPLCVLALRSRRAGSLAVLLSPLGLLGYWGCLRWSGRLSVVEAYRRYQGMVIAPPWAGLWESVRAPIVRHDALLGIRFGLIVLTVILSLRREIRPEDKLFALAVIAQMLLYAGRPAIGSVRYLLPIYPAFLGLGHYAQLRWNEKQFRFYVATFGMLNLVWMWSFLNWSLVV